MFKKGLFIICLFFVLCISIAVCLAQDFSLLWQPEGHNISPDLEIVVPEVPFWAESTSLSTEITLEEYFEFLKEEFFDSGSASFD